MGKTGSVLLSERVREADVPRAVPGQSIVLATWNVRELGRVKRSHRAIRMIARVLRSFSLVSLVELRRDTGDLERILDELGASWDAIYSEPLDDPGANDERACFLFNRRLVKPSGLVSMLLGKRKRGRDADEYVMPQWWRPPYMASFRAGKVDLVFATAHVRWGSTEKGRLGEIEALARWAEAKAKESTKPVAMVLAGDMNVPDTESRLYRALVSRGLEVPKALLGAHGTNLAANKRYDQLLHLPALGERFTERAGVLDFFRGDYFPLFPGERMTKQGFTRELSDHLPLWAELRVG